MDPTDTAAASTADVVAASGVPVPTPAVATRRYAAGILVAAQRQIPELVARPGTPVADAYAALVTAHARTLGHDVSGAPTTCATLSHVQAQLNLIDLHETTSEFLAVWDTWRNAWKQVPDERIASLCCALGYSPAQGATLVADALAHGGDTSSVLGALQDSLLTTYTLTGGTR